MLTHNMCLIIDFIDANDIAIDEIVFIMSNVIIVVVVIVSISMMLKIKIIIKSGQFSVFFYSPYPWIMAYLSSSSLYRIIYIHYSLCYSYSLYYSYSLCY